MMKKAFIYTGLQIKRVSRYLPFILLITLALCIALSLALYTLVDIDASDGSNQKLKVGIVGEVKDSYFEFGLSAIQSMDSSRFTIDIVDMTEEQAKEELRAGNIAGYVFIPEEFILDAVSGDVGHLSFVTKENGIDMFALFKEEVLDLIACMVVESQNGVYCMRDIIVDYKVGREDLSDHLVDLPTEYIGLILNRSNTIETEIIGFSDNLSFGGYMFAGLAVLLMLLCGITCCSLFIRRDMALPKLMNANRYSPCLQIAGEYTAFLCVMFINTLLLLSVMALGIGKSFDIIPELSAMSYMELLLLPIKLIPATLAITSLQFLLYEIVDSVVSGVLLQFITAVGLAYISGCLYPISFFPESIRIFSSFTPSGLARSYLASLLSGADSAVWLFALLGYSALLLGLTIIIRRRRIMVS